MTKTNIWPATTCWDPSGDAFIGQVSVKKIAHDYGTPVMIYDESDFRSRCRQFAEIFGAENVHYASKAFLTTTIAHWVNQEGLSLDVCSAGELYIAQQAHFPAHRITFHGNNKSESELKMAIEYGVGHIVIDSDNEIDRLAKIAQQYGIVQDVFIRLTLGIDAHTHEYVATNHEDQKFGFSVAHKSAHAAIQKIISSQHLRLVGLHSHIGSQITHSEAFIVAGQRTCDFIDEIVAEFGSTCIEHLKYIDIGGGYAIAYLDTDALLDLASLQCAINDVYNTYCTVKHLPQDNVIIQTEPGRAIVGTAGVTLYTVGTVKDVYCPDGSIRRYISVDGGMSDNIRPALYHADYSARLVGRISTASLVQSRVVGKHCESGDIVVHNCKLPADIIPGDLLLVAATGAYCYSMSSRYNAQPRPAVLAVNNGCTSLLLRRETFADILGLEVRGQ